jgi:hypothetical protein
MSAPRLAILAAVCVLAAACAAPQEPQVEQEAALAPGEKALQADLARLHERVPGLESRQTERGVVLTIGPGPQERLDEVARLLRAWPGQRVVVEGFAERSQALKEALVERGVEAQRIEAVGPRADQLDGRVEIVLPHQEGGAAAGR